MQLQHQHQKLQHQLAQLAVTVLSHRQAHPTAVATMQWASPLSQATSWPATIAAQARVGSQSSLPQQRDMPGAAVLTDSVPLPRPPLQDVTNTQTSLPVTMRHTVQHAVPAPGQVRMWSFSNCHPEWPCLHFHAGLGSTAK